MFIKRKNGVFKEPPCLKLGSREEVCLFIESAAQQRAKNNDVEKSGTNSNSSTETDREGRRQATGDAKHYQSKRREVHPADSLDSNSVKDLENHPNIKETCQDVSKTSEPTQIG